MSAVIEINFAVFYSFYFFGTENALELLNNILALFFFVGEITLMYQFF
jgi:hypothetical protein